MKIQFLGSGTMFATPGQNFQSNLLLIGDCNEGETPPMLLIDCGTHIAFSLHAAGLYFPNITDVYISHLHSDHVGGLEELAFFSKFAMGRRPNLYVHSFLKQELWARTLGGLKSIEGEEPADLETYFDVHVIPKNKSFVWNNAKLQPIQQVHVMDAASVMPSFGLMITVDGAKKYPKVYFTSDTKFLPDQMMAFYKAADLILQDCEVPYEVDKKTGEPVLHPETGKIIPIKSWVHAHYNDLLTLPPEIRAIMKPFHCQDNWAKFVDPVADGFLPIAQPGEVIEL